LTHFFIKAAKTLNKKTPTPPKELVTLLSTYSFPGNIRELESLVFDAVSRHTNRILSLDSFKSHIDTERRAKKGTSGSSSDETELVSFPDELPTIKEAVGLLVDEALKRADGNQTIAAKMLGISRQALGKRLKNR